MITTNYTTIANDLSIGTRISRQKLMLSQDEIELIDHIDRVTNSLMNLTNRGYLSKIQEKLLVSHIQRSILNSQPLSFVSIFCPPYKKGHNAFGYNSVVGETTRANIALLSKIENICTNAGLEFSVTIYFSDLLLENYEELQSHNYKHELALAFADLKHRASCFNVMKLSDLGNLAIIVGEAGPCQALNNNGAINNCDLQLLYARNQITYKSIYNWDDRKIQKRTDDLVLAYPYLADAMNKYHQNSIYFWSETAIERTRLMPNLNLPLFVPRKSEKDNEHEIAC